MFDSSLLATALGGLLAIAGGFVSQFVQAKYARKTRMDEIIAERKVTVYEQAYVHMKQIQSGLSSSGTGGQLKALQIFSESDGWFFGNRLYFPGRFPNKWLGIRKRLNHMKEVDSPQAQVLKDEAKRLAAEAIDEIYRELKLQRLEPE